MSNHHDLKDLSVAHMLAHGLDQVSVSCPRCLSRWRAHITVLPQDTKLAKVQELMMCRDCGDGKVDIEFVWPSGPGRLH